MPTLLEGEIHPFYFILQLRNAIWTWSDIHVSTYEKLTSCPPQERHLLERVVLTSECASNTGPSFSLYKVCFGSFNGYYILIYSSPWRPERFIFQSKTWRPPSRGLEAKDVLYIHAVENHSYAQENVLIWFPSISMATSHHKDSPARLTSLRGGTSVAVKSVREPDYLPIWFLPLLLTPMDEA